MRASPRLFLCTPGLVLGAFVVVGCSDSRREDQASSASPVVAANSGGAGGAAAIVGLAGKCLDDDGDDVTDGTKIQLWTCNGTDAQQWTFTKGTFVGPGGKCLDIQGDDQVGGTHVQLWGCNGTDAQVWTVQGSALVSTNGLCLDVTGASSRDGTQLQLWSCNGGPQQQWQLAGASVPAESPDCTTLTQAGASIIDASGAAWSLGRTSDEQVVYVNGQLAGYSADVTELLYHDHVLSQENAAGGWWDWANGTWNEEDDPSAGCISSPPPAGGGGGGGGGSPPVSGISGPAQAVNAGYATLALDDEFTSSATVQLASGDGTYNWYNANGLNYNPANSPSGDYYVDTTGSGVLVIQADASGYGAGLQSVPNFAGAPSTSTPTGILPVAANGRLFRYGYYEASMKWPNTPNQSWYPSFWCTGTGSPNCEIDFMETSTGDVSYSSLNNGVIQWTQDGNGSAGNFYWTNDYPNYSSYPSGVVDDTSAFNVYGCLWTPTGISFYWNNVLVNGPVPTTTEITVGQNNDPAPGVSGYGPADNQGMFTAANTTSNAVILGTGNHIASTIDWVRIWQ